EANKQAPDPLVGGGPRAERSRRAVGRVIPRWVARQQSPLPFHPALGFTPRIAAEQEQGAMWSCLSHEDWTGCSEETLVFCPNNGVHFKPDVLRLAKKIDKEKRNGSSQKQIALDFTDGDEQKADSLLRQLRRYPHLLN